MSDQMTAEDIRTLMAGEDDEGGAVGEPIPEAPGYDVAGDLLAGLSLMRRWGKVSVTAEHDAIRAYVDRDTVEAANRMGRDTLRALASLGWGFDEEREGFLRFV